MNFKNALVYRILLFDWIVQNLVTADNLFYLKYSFSAHGSLFSWTALLLAPAPIAVTLPVDCDDDDDGDDGGSGGGDDETSLLASPFKLLLYSLSPVSRDATTKFPHGYHHEHVYERSS